MTPNATITCPECGTTSSASDGRSCPACGYTLTAAEVKRYRASPPAPPMEDDAFESITLKVPSSRPHAEPRVPPSPPQPSFVRKQKEPNGCLIGVLIYIGWALFMLMIAAIGRMFGG